ncbi:hypothetical protein pipiens_000667, partial [Culex pipiens pipiens]
MAAVMAYDRQMR